MSVSPDAVPSQTTWMIGSCPVHIGFSTVTSASDWLSVVASSLTCLFVPKLVGVDRRAMNMSGFPFLSSVQTTRGVPSCRVIAGSSWSAPPLSPLTLTLDVMIPRTVRVA